MKCLIEAFDDGDVNTTEVDACKALNADTTHLDIAYPTDVPTTREDCVPSDLYPNTAAYKTKEFGELKEGGKGRVNDNACASLTETSTVATDVGGVAIAGCSCSLVVVTGDWSPG